MGLCYFFFVYVIVMYIWCVKVLYTQKASEFYQRENAEDTRNRWKASMRLTRYPLIFVLMWIFPIINRVQNWVAGDDGVFWLTLLHTICISIQGTLNSIAYCIDEDIFYHCTPKGIKQAFIGFFKQRNSQQQIQKYHLRRNDEEEDPDPSSPRLQHLDPVVREGQLDTVSLEE